MSFEVYSMSQLLLARLVYGTRVENRTRWRSKILYEYLKIQISNTAVSLSAALFLYACVSNLEPK